MTEPCKSARMRDHACANRHQCWEPCGELGKSEAHAHRAQVEAAVREADAPDAKFIPHDQVMAEMRAIIEGAEHARAVTLHKAFPTGGPILGEDGPLLAEAL